MSNPRIIAAAWGVLEGERPRPAGSNARLGPHGATVRVPLLRLTDEEGVTGFGHCRATPEETRALIGRRLDEVFAPGEGIAEPWLAFDFPLWDLAAHRAGLPVYALAAAEAALHGVPLLVPCYDTSLYFDDLHLPDDRAAAALIAAEAREGYARGHRAFKVKVGRGARHMPPEEGTRRDIAVVRAVRAAVGPEAPLMLDANNGYTLNLAKRVLEATAGCGIFWLEEAFHEDEVLYRDLKAWLAERGLATLIADGEGPADPRLPDWAREGVVDVVQYDIFERGFTRWLALGRRLDAWGVRSAPHHYGGFYGNFAAGHLAGAVRGFAFVEWDEAHVPGIDTSAYAIVEGQVAIPQAPGFGLELDEERFAHAVAGGGYRCAS
ncbi:MAG TPA: enolase C-terminal domain-like protein [Roseiflexaceae bacterium]|nr:enolase C-terminal domain-like protein [Roseiflexaceae bacterium]